MTPTAAIEDLCRRWFPGRSPRVEPLRGSGFSGSSLFRVDLDDGGRFVLKRFHDDATRERALFVHSVAAHLRAAGVAEIPAVVAAEAGGTVVEDATGGLWEMVDFVPGGGVERPSEAQAASALALLARIHGLLARHPQVAAQEAVSPGLLRRIEQARRLRSDSWRRRRAAIIAAARAVDDRFEALLHRLSRAVDVFDERCGDAFLERIGGISPSPCRVQIVFRDVWFDHVLFAKAGSASVAGIIDLHAAGIDTPATDVARLLGSWEAPEARAGRTLCERWEGALAAYEQIRPLGVQEHRLVPVLHATGIVLGLDNWFHWTLEQGRRFPGAPRVLERIDRLLAELPHALAWPQ